jgi:hypothetical protein
MREPLDLFRRCLTSNERTEFEHRAEAKEFNNPKKEKYVIIAIVARRQKEPIPERFRSLKSFRETYSNRLRAIDLKPARAMPF